MRRVYGQRAGTVRPVAQAVGYKGQSAVSEGGGAAFDPADLNLSIYLDGPYAGSPWVGLPSTGTSGGRNFAEATNAPSAGSALNGINAAVFDGVNDRLTNATTLTNIIGASAWSGVALINTNTFVAGNASWWLDTPILADEAGYWSVATGTLSGNKFGLMGAYAGGGTSDTVNLAGSEGSWQLIKFKWNGTRLFIAKNDDAFGAGVVSTGPDARTGAMRMGIDFANTLFLKSSIMTLLVSPDLWDDATFDDIRSYLNAKYAITLGAPFVSSVNKPITRTQGGILLTISGINLTDATAVTIGGTAATSVTVVDDHTITCVTPAKAAGAAYAVVVTAPLGASNSSTTIQYVNPSSIFGANLERWYDSTYAAGAWTDESANFNTSQATEGKRPTASTFAGTTDRPATEFGLTFDGTDDALNMGNATDIVTGAYTMAFIATAGVTQNAEANVMSKNYSSEAFVFGIRSVSADKMASGAGGTTTTELAISNSTVNDDVLRRYINTHTAPAGNASSLYVNGTLQTDTGVGAYTTATADYNAIGAAMADEATTDYHFTGKVGQCIIANVVADATQLSELDAYLRDCAGQAA